MLHATDKVIAANVVPHFPSLLSNLGTTLLVQSRSYPIGEASHDTSTYTSQSTCTLPEGGLVVPTLQKFRRRLLAMLWFCTYVLVPGRAVERDIWKRLNKQHGGSDRVVTALQALETSARLYPRILCLHKYESCSCFVGDHAARYDNGDSGK